MAPAARSLLAWLVACMVGWLLGGPLPAAAQAVMPAGPAVQAVVPVAGQTLDAAWFASQPQGPWRVVPLPDTWSLRDQPRPAMGWYRLAFTLPAVTPPSGPSAQWALGAERLSSRHRVWVNGQLLRDTLLASTQANAQVASLMIHLPPAMLREGDNQLDIQVDGGLRAGLSPLLLGPAIVVDQLHVARLGRQVLWPQQLNAAAAGACLFALLMWWRRPSETAMGWFGLLGMLASLRNQAYYSANPGLPGGLTSLMFFVAQIVSVLLLGLFAMSLTRQRPRAYRPVLFGGTALLLAVGLVVAIGSDDPGALDRVRALGYPMLGLLALPALWMIGARVKAMRGGELAALLGALLMVVVAGVHDYLYQQGRLALTDQWWLPFATPLMVLAFAVLMVRRVVTAMSQVEVLNQTLEQRVKDRTEALAVAHAAKSRFLAAASHDLRQPVVTIGLLVGLLREQITAPALRSMVVKVDEAVAAMESLLAGLLDLSRLESGTVRARWQRVPLQALFDAVAVHESEAARRKGLHLRVRPTDAAVQADPVLLEQIVRNLVSNAVRYTDAGGVLLAARHAGPGRLSIQVWDTGPGIAPDKQAAVFEEFVQLDNPQRDRAKGLGLGLAIVQRSAALLQAPLQLRSRLGRGSCFSLTLALADTAAMPAPVRPQDERWMVGLQVVLVEDDPAVREALSTRLTAWGAQVQAHAEPRALRQALDALQPGQRQADLLITDLRLPGGTGFDVADLARRRYGPLPVLVITGNTAPDELAQLSARQLPVLHKPFRADQLRTALALALGEPPKSP